MNIRKYVSLIIAIFFFCSQLFVVELSAGEYEFCRNWSNWSVQGTAIDVDCGVCSSEGDYVQTRNLGTCFPACHPVTCPNEVLATERTKTYEQLTVTLPEQQACTAVKTFEQSVLAGAFASCCTGSGGLGIPACTALFLVGMLAADCAYDDCVYDCQVSGWATTATGTGCTL